MITEYERDFAWSYGLNPQVRDIIQANAHLFVEFRPATRDQDIHQATDDVFTTPFGNFAYRVRREITFRDLTIRSSRASGVKTELDKIQEGYGDYYFYGWTYQNNIEDWMIITLDRLRSSGLLDNHEETMNTDGSSAFISIGIKQLSKYGCILAGFVKGKRLTAGTIVPWSAKKVEQ